MRTKTTGSAKVEPTSSHVGLRFFDEEVAIAIAMSKRPYIKKITSSLHYTTSEMLAS